MRYVHHQHHLMHLSPSDDVQMTHEIKESGFELAARRRESSKRGGQAVGLYQQKIAWLFDFRLPVFLFWFASIDVMRTVF